MITHNQLSVLEEILYTVYIKVIKGKIVKKYILRQKKSYLST